jgi:hypothetical protein
MNRLRILQDLKGVGEGQYDKGHGTVIPTSANYEELAAPEVPLAPTFGAALKSYFADAA